MTDKIIGWTCIAIVVASMGLLYAAPAINQWERAHGYPYGKLCSFYGTCRP